MSENFIDLEINGRVFPSWITLNFKEYELPEVLLEEGKDPCAVKDIKSGLRKYQEFLAKYLSYNSPFKDILMYHGLGSG